MNEPEAGDKRAGIHEGGAAAGWHDPSGATGIGPPTEYVEFSHRRCVISCRDPWPGRRRFRCPSCNGPAWTQERCEEPTRLELTAARLGSWSRMFVDGWREAGAVLRLREKERLLWRASCPGPVFPGGPEQAAP